MIEPHRPGSTLPTGAAPVRAVCANQVCTAAAGTAGSDHAEAVERVEALLDEVRRACQERGLKLTPIRAEALRRISEVGKPIKAYDLLERMRGGPGASAPPTVYRALEFLLDHGFIHKLVSINAYLACHHPCSGHVVPILICRCCESAQELEDEALAADLDALARAEGFQPSTSYLEVLGTCSHCSEHE